MMALLAEFVPIGQANLLAGFVVFLRVGAAMALLPAFGERSVPQRVRLGLALAFTLVVAPAVTKQTQGIVSQGSVIGPFVITEVIIGLALGMILRLLVLVLQIAGQVAAQATSLSQIFGGAGVEPMPAMGNMMMMAGLALAVMGGLHVRAAEVMILSYDILPPAQFPDASALTDWGLGHIAHGFGLAITLAMPFVIASLVYNLALGVINRAMPQLMVALVGAPAITAGGLVLMFLALPQLLGVWQAWMDQLLTNPFGAMP